MRARVFLTFLTFVSGCGIDVLGTRPPSADGGGVDGGGGVDEGGADVGADASSTSYRVFGLGDGHDKALDVTTGSMVVNTYAAVTAPVAVGSTTIPIGTLAPAGAAIAAGDLVLLWQTAGALALAPGNDSEKIDLAGTNIGRWELVRAVSVAAMTLTLDMPTTIPLTVPGAQIVRVREYTNVTVAQGAKVTAIAWDGARGGIVAFLATGAVTNAGEITTNGLGFRGGQNPTVTFDGCTGPDGDPANGYARKGEGVIGQRGGGFGSLANGGGGGDCHNGGGGGGGNAGVGGRGGRTYDNGRDVGGKGGSPLSFSLVTHLTLGGGGGAGEGGDADILPGNPGGGAVFLRAKALSGAGTITANGAFVTARSGDAGGGGGAGGSLYLRFVGTASCATVAANGGAGGNSDNDADGPGGGGGGGRVLFQAMTVPSSCTTSVRAGKAGVTPQPSNRFATPVNEDEAGFVGIVDPHAGPYCATCNDEP